MSPSLYFALLALTLRLRLLRGGRYERLVAIVCLLATLATVAA